MTKGQTILLTGGALATVGIIYFGFIKKYENGLTWYKGLSDGGSGTSGNNPDTTGNSKGNPPVLPPVQSAYSGKNVYDVLLGTQDSKLKGLKVYANTDGTKVVKPDYSPYTIAKKGELLGTFSSSKNTSAGDKLVEIYTGKSPAYVVTSSKMLKF